MSRMTGPVAVILVVGLVAVGGRWAAEQLGSPSPVLAILLGIGLVWAASRAKKRIRKR